MDRKIRVMLVDDEKAIRNVLKMTVPWTRFDMEIVEEAASGIEALNKIEKAEPDLIIADIKMPFMDGLEFSRIAMKQNPELAIIILTAYEDFGLVREALRLGAADYFVKPVDAGDIAERLEKVKSTIYQNWDKKQKQVVINIENPEKTVAKINRYILKNYANPELNVAHIANCFGFDRSYLSRMYKKETGMLLIDYLIECRMNLAVKMAESGQKMYITAEQVGMPDANYFGKCFKKYVGVSYSEYQKRKNNG